MTHEVDAPLPQRSQPPTPRDPGLVRLLSLLEQASEGSHELDKLVAEVAAGPGEWRPYRGGARKTWYYSPSGVVLIYGESGIRRYTTSFDAALSLVPDGWTFQMHSMNVEGEMVNEAAVDYRGWQRGASLPIAIVIASLKARV